MSNGRARDHEHFNCSEEHEFNYVSSLYTQKEEVYDFLKESCEKNDINYSTHDEVYALIKDKLGYDRK